MASIAALGIGSGLDLNGLLDQLNAAERQKLAPLSAQKKSFQTKISAYGQLESALTQFKSAVAKLNKPELFQSVKSTVAGDALSTAASENAAIGQYQVKVTTLASAYSIATAGVDDRSRDLAGAGGGSIDISLVNGESFSVALDAGASSLEDIRDAINAAEGGVSASIVNDGDAAAPYRLALHSTDTGSQAAIASVAFNDLADLTLDTDTEVVAKDAALTINGIAIASQRNQVEGAIEGLTLNLKEEGDATVTVARDEENIKGAIEGFVKAYNSLQKNMDVLSAYDAESGSAGSLLGDAVLRNVESQLRRNLNEGVGDGGINLLSEAGIELQLNGTLELDGDKLDALVDTELGELAAFFSGDAASETDGLAGLLDGVLERMLDDKGMLANASDGLETSIGRVDERYAAMERSIGATIARYRTQFGQLDSMISQMNSTSAYLTQQFDMMNAQLGRKS